MRCYGIRGATTVEHNTKESILSASKELLQQMIAANGVDTEDIAVIWFTATNDLTAEFPAAAAREMGMVKTALMCGHEMNVPGSLPQCLRIMMLVNTEKKKDDIAYVYIKGAEVLRSEFSPLRTGDDMP
ncbi:chorismate mutase [Chloroflexota bacterium]